MITVPSYLLITAARNEAEFIELTIRSVISQTVLPRRWVIVSDGSTDGTDDIVGKYQATHPWIELVRLPERRERHFAGKVHAFNAGLSRVSDLEYQAIGNLDADVSLDQDHFFFLLTKLKEDPFLGVVGTAFLEDGHQTYDYRFSDTGHVSGPCQLFRRECFEEIGGYVASRIGGIDVIAVTSARMKGWKTKTFPEKLFKHHRVMGMAGTSRVGAEFRQGVKDYVLGNHPIWEVSRTVYQMRRPPFLLRGLALGSGYISALIRRIERAGSHEFISFRRREQIFRLGSFITGQGAQTCQIVQPPATSFAGVNGQLPSYVLITPARDEAKSIELTIKCVMAQTARPLKWVIVSDGSTDGTDSIVSKYTADHPWIELVRMPERSERDFGAKVRAFNAGYARVGDLNYEVIGNLDADMSFDQDYFHFLLQKLVHDQSLGLVGTPFKDSSIGTYDYRFVGIEHVCGACQLFRRQCFEEIGGYTPINGGGVDLVAAITARMKGWETRTFTEKISQHHRGIGTSHGGRLAARFHYGMKDYVLGGHPLWQFLRAIYQMTKKPFVLGGLLLGTGYLWAFVRGMKRPISREFMEFRRREQLARLRRLLTSHVIPASEAAQQPSRAA